jgi:hypothetical protein
MWKSALTYIEIWLGAVKLKNLWIKRKKINKLNWKKMFEEKHCPG